MPHEPFTRPAARCSALSADSGADRKTHQAKVVVAAFPAVRSGHIFSAPVLGLETGGHEADRTPADPSLILRAYLEFEDVEQSAIRFNDGLHTAAGPVYSAVAIDARPLCATEAFETFEPSDISIGKKSGSESPAIELTF